MKTPIFLTKSIPAFTLALSCAALLLVALPAETRAAPKAKAVHAEDEFREQCPATREFVTTLEYLRAGKGQLASEKDARKVALEVAQGCSGAGMRFIRVSQVLLKAGVIAPQALNAGIEFSRLTNAEAEAFVSVFQRAFLEEYLDLDVASSMAMARSLSSEFEGDVLRVRSDFERVLDYCIQEKSLNLPKPQCGTLASRIARLGQKFSGGVSESYINAVEFFRSPKGPAMTTGDAMRKAEELVVGGRGAVDNFLQAYRYASSKSGLNMDRAEALNFAKNMADQALRSPRTSAQR